MSSRTLAARLEESGGAALRGATAIALGTVGCVGRTPEWIAETARAIREKTDRPFGLNLLLFDANEQALEAVFKTKPPVFSTAWAWPDQDLASLFSRAHELGAKVMHMVSGVPEARRAAAAGADAIVAQGTEGGGHVGLMGTMALVPQVIRAVALVPVLAAGGIATGAGARRRGRASRDAFPRDAGGADCRGAQAGDPRQRRARHASDGDPGHRQR